jgi:multiple sugar transport system substrate-binding protein
MTRTRRAGGGIACGVALGLLVLGAPGCGGSSSRAPTAAAPPTFAGAQLRGAVVDPAPAPAAAGGLDPLVVLLNGQRGEWEAQRQAKVVFQAATAEGAITPETADVVAFRADRLGALLDAGSLAPIPEAAVRPPLPPAEMDPSDAAPGEPVEAPADPIAFSDILPVYRDAVARYGGELMALPLGGSALVLVYRRDLFDQPGWKANAKAAGVALEPPRTYAQLDAQAKFLDGRDWNGDGRSDRAIAMAFKEDADGLATATFLARAAAGGQHPDHFAFLFDDETMAPRVAWPPFVEALSGLVGLLPRGPDGMAGFDAEAARAAYREGRVAMLIDRADRASRWTDPKKPVPTGVARLPGSPRVFDPVRKSWAPIDPPNRPTLLPRGGGWLVGVSKAAKDPRPALDLVLYLGGADTAGHLLSDRQFPMLPVRSALLGGGLPNPRGAPGVDARGWGRAIFDTMTTPRTAPTAEKTKDEGTDARRPSHSIDRIVPDLRIPEADGYLADLAVGLAAAASGGATPESALKEVEARWIARTATLGVERQLWHYRRSLNRRTTTGSPPPRPAAPPAPAPAP